MLGMGLLFFHYAHSVLHGTEYHEASVCRQDITDVLTCKIRDIVLLVGKYDLTEVIQHR